LVISASDILVIGYLTTGQQHYC